MYLAVKVLREAVEDVARFTAMLYQAFKQWFQPGCEKQDKEQDRKASNKWRRRVVFVVAIHSGTSYNAIKDAVGGSLDEEDPPNFIDWESNEIGKLPKPDSFLRHFAVCLVPLEVWNDVTVTPSQKFRCATFIELVGPILRPLEGDGVRWNEENIQSIDGILEVGLVTYDDETVSQQFYKPLREAWGTYDTSWWNCFVFAMRLACIMLPDHEEKIRLQEMIECIVDSRAWDHRHAMRDSHWRVATAAWVGGVGSGGAMLGSLLLLGSLPVALPIMFCGGCTTFMGATVLGDLRSSRVGANNVPKWMERSGLGTAVSPA